MHTAHSMIVSLDHSALTWQRISGPMGRRGVALFEDLRMPRSTSESFGIGVDLGSGRLC